MNRLYIAAVAALMVLVGIGAVAAQEVKLGATFRVERLVKDDSVPTSTLVVFVPSLTYYCEYASMLTQGFHYYFDEGLAFEGAEGKPKTRIIFVVNDKYDKIMEVGNLPGRMTVIYDEHGILYKEFGIRLPTSKNSDATVLLLDRNNKIAFVDSAYRAQGEHLKPLESEIRKLNGLSPLAGREAGRALKVGDIAPDFRINAGELLSDLRGSVVLLTFYPAAFSGILPRPFVIEGAASVSSVWAVERGDAMSCSWQIGSLDVKIASASRPIRRIAITSSTEEILTDWKAILNTENIEYANDRDYSAATMYSAFNPKGYNNRVSVVVDKNGRIAYIDKEYSLKDQVNIQNMLVDLSQD